ncbi:amidohydrolase family protein [Paraburkholderia agricolaris]|uniref:6-methylsalicylate decarboxylase n=1 Tax=Paraburkholderia agricolaris TaxID=2152888 RepID=A0ABW9A2G3_9BURK
MNAVRRIDVHQHVVPPFWADELPSNGGDQSGTAIPRWSPQSAVDMMDSQQIATGILSLTAPSVAAWKPDERRTMARRVNEYTADLVVKRPTRFGHFATLPLPDVDGALHELGYALDELRADGVVLLSNYEGKYLADPTFEPLWAELDRRRAVVFVHPGLPQIRGLDAVAAPMVDYPFDTTRAAVQLVQNGIIDRYPHVRIILAHAGGFLPYASHRFAQLARVFRPDADSPADILAKFRRFYFDTALSASPVALPALKAFAGTERILFGSDFPYVSADIAGTFTAQLDAYEDFTVAEHKSVNHGNAWTLFPRLAPQYDKPA